MELGSRAHCEWFVNLVTGVNVPKTVAGHRGAAVAKIWRQTEVGKATVQKQSIASAARNRSRATNARTKSLKNWPSTLPHITTFLHLISSSNNGDRCRNGSGHSGLLAIECTACHEKAIGGHNWKHTCGGADIRPRDDGNFLCTRLILPGDVIHHPHFGFEFTDITDSKDIRIEPASRYLTDDHARLFGANAGSIATLPPVYSLNTDWASFKARTRNFCRLQALSNLVTAKHCEDNLSFDFHTLKVYERYHNVAAGEVAPHFKAIQSNTPLEAVRCSEECGAIGGWALKEADKPLPN